MGRSNDEPLTAAWAHLTTEEARHLYTSPAYYFRDDDSDPDWHCYAGGGDRAHESTIAIDT